MFGYFLGVRLWHKQLMWWPAATGRVTTCPEERLSWSGGDQEATLDIQDLLAQGWTPVRETGMGGGEHFAYALVLLKNESS
jgi:hypothetical protein